jgi:hypothetical protein
MAALYSRNGDDINSGQSYFGPLREKYGFKIPENFTKYISNIPHNGKTEIEPCNY